MDPVSVADRISWQPLAVVVLCTMLQLCFGTVYAWSFFQTLLVRDLAWTYSETAWAFSITIFSLGISAAIAGALLPKTGPRLLAVIGGIMFCAGYFIGSYALKIDSLWLFFAGYGVIGGMGIGLGYVTPVATTARWFPGSTGLATGVVVMGFGVGALLLTQVLAPFLVVRTEGDLVDLFFWLGVVFSVLILPAAMAMRNPPIGYAVPTLASAKAADTDDLQTVRPCLTSPAFLVIWLVFFFNISAGLAVISFQSPLLQEVWGLADPSVEPETLARYGAALIAVSSVCNGVGRLLWGMLADRFGRVPIFRILMASQMVVFGVLLTESDPYIFSALVCYVLLCFGGGFAVMPSLISNVFGAPRMPPVYGAVLTAWAAAGIYGPLYVGYLKDAYPDRAVIYCFLIGMLMLGAGWVFTYLLNDDPVRLRKPTLASTLAQFGITRPTRTYA